MIPMKMEIQRNKTAVAVVAAAVVAALVTYFVMRPQTIGVRTGTSTRIEFKSELVTLKVPVTQILTAKGKRYEGSWFVSGWANLGIEMRDVGCVRTADGSAEYRIPEAKVLDVALDFEKSMKWDIKRTAWYPNPFDGEPNEMRDAWQKAAQVLVRKSAEDPKLREIARNQARQVVAEQIRQLKLKPVEVDSPQQAP